jgi:hypothetical protein
VKPSHKLLVSFVLPLLMLLTQLGALQHELSHFSRAPVSSNEHKSLPGTQHCELCLAFAHASGGVRTESFLLRLGEAVHVLRALPVVHETVVSLPARRNRDPPIVL